MHIFFALLPKTSFRFSSSQINLILSINPSTDSKSTRYPVSSFKTMSQKPPASLKATTGLLALKASKTTEGNGSSLEVNMNTSHAS